jgi:hypothetical protein
MNLARAADVAVVVTGLCAAAGASARPLREVGKIAVSEGVIGEGFALDERGGRIAYLVTDGKGTAHLHVGAPGGAAGGKATDLTRFSNTPERVVSVAGGWFVIANEGQRRAAAVGPNGALGREVGPFSEAFVSTVKGPAFVTVTDRGNGKEGHGFDIAAFRAGGVQLGRKAVTIAADETIAGTPGLTFQAFEGGYLQALVRKAGKYDARADARGGQEIAVYDVLTGAVGGAHRLGDLRRFADLVVKRNERPGWETFVRLDDQATGLELVGPGEKLRPLALPAKLARYDAASLQQQQNGARLYLALVLDPLAAVSDPAERKPARALHIFEVNAASARATLVGEIPLGDDQRPYAWSAGGDKVAFMRTTHGGAPEILIYAR